jgi:hypothetical protein
MRMFEVGKRYRGVGDVILKCTKHDTNDNTFFFEEEGGSNSAWTFPDGLGFWTRDRIILGEYIDHSVFAERVAARIVSIIEEEIAKCNGGDK